MLVCFHLEHLSKLSLSGDERFRGIKLEKFSISQQGNLVVVGDMLEPVHYGKNCAVPEVRINDILHDCLCLTVHT